jgi:hypothetical protein
MVEHEGEEGERATAVGDLGPEKGTPREKEPIEHDGDEGDGAETGEQKLQVSGEGLVLGGLVEIWIAQEATQPFVGGAMAAVGAGKRAGKATDREGAALEEGSAKPQEVLALVAVPRQGKVVDEGAKCGNMSR